MSEEVLNLNPAGLQTQDGVRQGIHELKEQMKLLMDMSVSNNREKVAIETERDYAPHPPRFIPVHLQQTQGVSSHFVHDLEHPRAQGDFRSGVPNSIPISEVKHKWEILEERLRAIEGVNIYGTANAADLCLVQDIIIPPKFKVPDFDKYDGTSCPQNHLIMYCRKMAAYVHDEKLLIHFFQNSLTGTSARWYLQLDRSFINSWKDLASAFVKQYRYNIDMTPDRMELQRMEKKSTETFKQYAQRWRELAAQVQPPLSDKEMAATFINTLHYPYYDRIIGNTTTNFTDIVIIGERIEDGIKKGRIRGSPTERSTQTRDDSDNSEIQVVGQDSGSPWKACYNPRPPYPTQYPLPHYPYQNPFSHIDPIPQTPSLYQGPCPQVNNTNRVPYPHPYPNQSMNLPIFRPSTPTVQSNTYLINQQGRTPGRNVTQFNPIPMSYTELLPQLLQNGQIVCKPIKPLQPPYPKWYDPEARCDFHVGAVGHSTEDCLTLKERVQALIKTGRIDFKEVGDVQHDNVLPS